MLEFIFGYALGSSARNSTPMSGTTVAIVALVLMAIAGLGYTMLPIMFPESVPQSVEQCGGERIAAMMCGLASKATAIGTVIVGIVTLVAVVWVLFVSTASSEK